MSLMLDAAMVTEEYAEEGVARREWQRISRSMDTLGCDALSQVICKING
jgi:hypothetical protein